MVKDIMEYNFDNFEYGENQSLRNILNKYASVIESQKITIEDLRAQLDSLKASKKEVDVDSMIADLEQAQDCLSEVYGVACDAGLSRVEDLMSCADSCISEAMDVLQNRI
jgi:Zn-dependent oligopeptidase